MLLGILFGILMLQINTGKDLVVDWIKPFGTIFINSLKLITKHSRYNQRVSDLKDLAVSKWGVKLFLYTITTVTAVTIGLVIVNVVQLVVSEKAQADLVAAYSVMLLQTTSS